MDDDQVLNLDVSKLTSDPIVKLSIGKPFANGMPRVALYTATDGYYMYPDGIVKVDLTENLKENSND